MFCSMGDYNKTLSDCVTSPLLIDVDTLISKVDEMVGEGLLDHTDNIRSRPVYIFHGTQDTTVLPEVGKKAETMYKHYGADLKTEYSIEAEHGMPTNNESNQACTKNETPFINYCEYDAAFEEMWLRASKAASYSQ